MFNSELDDDVHPHSPFGVASSLLGQYLEKKLSEKEFLESIERFEVELEKWAKKLQGIEIPEDYEAGDELIEASFEGLDHIADGLECLKVIPETDDSASAQQGLVLIKEGQSLLRALEKLTAFNIEDAIEAQSGSLYLE